MKNYRLFPVIPSFVEETTVRPICKKKSGHIFWTVLQISIDHDYRTDYTTDIED